MDNSLRRIGIGFLRQRMRERVSEATARGLPNIPVALAVLTDLLDEIDTLRRQLQDAELRHAQPG